MKLKVFGVHTDGGMAEYVCVPADKVIRNTELDQDQLALVEPFATGAHAIRRSQLQRDEFIVEVGAGPIGLGIMEFARIQGGKVIAIDVSEERLTFVKDNLQTVYAINSSSSNAVESVAELTNGEMASIVIDATGNLEAINKYVSHRISFDELP